MSPTPDVLIDLRLASTPGRRVVSHREFKSIEAFVEFWNNMRDEHGQHSIRIDEDEDAVEFRSPR